MGGMAMNWKTLLYEYAHSRNRMEAECDPSVLQPLGESSLDWGLQGEKLQRIREQRRERRLVAVSREVRLRILRARPIRGGLLADIRLHSRFAYRIDGADHLEERAERESVYLSALRGGWAIAGIEPDTRELTGGAVFPPEGGAANAAPLPANLKPMLNPLAQFRRAGGYDRQAAADYADRYWETANPGYLEFEVDCSNYVSQCIFAGGAPMNYTDRRDSGWWYRGMSGSRENWSYSWAVADSLRRYLAAGRSHGLRAKAVESAQELEPGDVISYCWKGDGRFGHSTVVASKDKNGMPLVNAHTVSSKHRYWDYRDSYAWTENTRYLFFHITDLF